MSSLMMTKRLLFFLSLLAIIGGVALLLSKKAHREDPSWIDALLRRAFIADGRFYTERLLTNRVRLGQWVIVNRVKVLSAPGQKIRCEYLSGPLKDVTIGYDGQKAWRFDPEKPMLEILNASPKLLGPPYALLKQNYVGQLLGERLLIGRKAVGIGLKPKQPGEPSLELWIDEKTGLPLHYIERNERGEVVCETRTERLTYLRSVPSKLFCIPKIPVLLKVVQRKEFSPCQGKPEVVRRWLQSPLYRPRYIPEGYSLVRYYRFRCPWCRVPGVQMVYSNGLETISVFQSKDSCMRPALAPGQMVDLGLARVIFEQRGPSCFWVVGLIPPQELKQIAQSIRP